MRAWILIVVATGCAQAHTVGESRGELGSKQLPIVPGCEKEVAAAVEKNTLPKHLGCTGLYTARHSDELSESVRPFEPASKLWSDDSLKSRWFRLPEDEVIDTSEPGEWKFPVGTQFWKEFRRGDTLVETRLFLKHASGEWAWGAYVWNDAQDAAELLPAGTTVEVDGVEHDVPSSRQCAQCHNGHDDRVLGFEAVSLGLPNENPDALTLQQLADEGLLSDPPERTELEIGDDGTGLAAPALSWLHINCGVGCHNPNTNAAARKTGMVLKLDVSLLDGRAPDGLESLQTTLGVSAKTQQWIDRPRIVPGEPDMSLLVELAETRVPGGGNKQMPPLGTRIVDRENLDKVRAWIAAIEPGAQP